MADRLDARTPADYHVDGFAQIVERIGLGIMGGLCGLFVAALVAKANIEEFNSLGVLFSALLYGSIGFYLGTSIPATSSNVTRAFFATDLRMNPIALASANGTLLAALAALIAVAMIVFDEIPPVIWSVGIGFGWMIGVLLQIAAGTTARLGRARVAG
jgi:hypothetical protein